jgi:hypothetical protein
MFRPRLTARYLAVACLFSPALALSAEIGWSGSLGVAMKNYSRDVSTTGDISYDGTITDPADGVVLDTLSYTFIPTMAVDADATLPMLSTQGVMTVDKWYFSLKLEDSLSDPSVDYSEEADYSADMSRMDTSIVAGYRLDNGWSVFGGLLKAETEETGSVEFSPGDAVPIDATLDVDGVLVGSSYSWAMGSGGMSISGAVTSLDVESNELDFDGTNVGISLAATWSAPLTDSLNYFVDARLQRYEAETSTTNDSLTENYQLVIEAGSPVGNAFPDRVGRTVDVEDNYTANGFGVSQTETLASLSAGIQMAF